VTNAKTNAPKGKVAAEIARGFFGLQLRYADALARTGVAPLAGAITFHTNLHRLFAYGNLGKDKPDPAFLDLVGRAVSAPDEAARLDLIITAYADRPEDAWSSDRCPFGKHFACEEPNAEGVVRIHFRNKANADAVGPLDISNTEYRRTELKEMFGHVARTWPQAKTVNGASWLYNTEAYRRLFPAEYTASRTPLLGPRSTHGLSHWGQFLDFRGYLKPNVAETFYANLKALDPKQPWLAFPYPVLQTTAPFEVFSREYGV
jgi:hypothetical protein